MLFFQNFLNLLVVRSSLPSILSRFLGDLCAVLHEVRGHGAHEAPSVPWVVRNIYGYMEPVGNYHMDIYIYIYIYIHICV